MIEITFSVHGIGVTNYTLNLNQCDLDRGSIQYEERKREWKSSLSIVQITAGATFLNDIVKSGCVSVSTCAFSKRLRRVSAYWTLKRRLLGASMTPFAFS